MINNKPKLSDHTAQPIPELQVPDFKPKKETHGKRWERCTSCNKFVFIEVNAKEYYHAITCKKSNGIRYGTERNTIANI